MKTFLKTIARAYRERYGAVEKLVFVMPNKRSGDYLLHSFARLQDIPAIGPRIMSITEFVESVSETVPASRIDLLFRLFVCYTRLAGEEQKMSFDRFMSAGESLLNDFNEIDMQLADPDEIFGNLYDLNALRSTFLSKRHKKVMAEYFSRAPEFVDTDEDGRLWKRFTRPGEGGEARKKFVALWQLLNPLYKELKADLLDNGLNTSGGLFREAVEKIEGGFEPFEGEKIVFVGFNALSESEAMIFSLLKEMTVAVQTTDGLTDEPKADFLWDLAPAVFAESDGPALNFVRVNSRKENFPMPEWISRPLRHTIPEGLPDITVISVPSNVMQTKVAGRELEKLGDGKTAVVLPDENLLVPLLYSLPSNLRHPNLTMGFPLRQTQAVSFASLLKRLQQGGVVSGNEPLFRFEDVKDLLAHPYAHILFDRKTVGEFIKGYERQKRIMVPLSSLRRLGANCAVLFRLFEDEGKPREVIDYLLGLYSMVKKEIGTDSADVQSEGTRSFLRADLERVFIGAYTDALIRLSNSIGHYGIPFTPRDIFLLAERLIAGETVSFEGNRIGSLQIMGVLETRCLDFDNIIILSMNEKMMPRVGRSSTFIPNIIRNAYGLPPANYQEEIFAYYFYRVLGRCTKAVLTYDSRASENRTPGPSRYLLQLKYLGEGGRGRELEARFNLTTPPSGEIIVDKGAEIQARLDRFLADGLPDNFDGKDRWRFEKKFSASALSNYFQCQLRFLFQNVLDLGEERDKPETIDAIDMGTIVHNAIENLYFPPDMRGKMLGSPLVLTKEFLASLLDEETAPALETRIERECRKAILKVHFLQEDDRLEKGKLRGSAAIIFPYIVGYIKKILEADMQQAPLRLWGSEIKRTVEYRLPSGRTVRFKVVIDRLDQEGESGASPFRIVDYKTGAVKLTADNMEQLMDGTFKAHNIFQLLLYAEIFLLMVKRGEIILPEGMAAEDLENSLRTVIYNVPSLPSAKAVMPPCIGFDPGTRGGEVPHPVNTMGDLRLVETGEGITFMDMLDRRLEELFDPHIPFTGEPAESKCLYCEFRLRCEMMREKV